MSLHPWKSLPALSGADLLSSPWQHPWEELQEGGESGSGRRRVRILYPVLPRMRGARILNTEMLKRDLTWISSCLWNEIMTSLMLEFLLPRSLEVLGASIPAILFLILLLSSSQSDPRVKITWTMWDLSFALRILPEDAQFSAQEKSCLFCKTGECLREHWASCPCVKAWDGPLGFHNGSWASHFSLGHGFCIWGGGLAWVILEIHSSSNILWELKQIGNSSLIFILTCLHFFLPVCSTLLDDRQILCMWGLKITSELSKSCLCLAGLFFHSFIHSFIQETFTDVPCQWHWPPALCCVALSNSNRCSQFSLCENWFGGRDISP